MIGCDCNAGLSNTGRPGCVPLFSIISSLILVPLTANDGTKNRIDLNAALPVWNDLINEDDASKRWFPLPAMENVESPKADSLTEEAGSGRTALLREGKRSLNGEFWAEDSTPTFLGKLKNSRCVDFGIFVIDVEGNLIGSEVDGFLYPISVENSSWDPKFSFATDSTVQKIMLGFDWDRLFRDETMYQITPNEAIDFTTLEGLKDVLFTNVVALALTTTFDAKLCYGTALNKILYSGAGLIADWSVFNNTTQLPVVIDMVDEGPDGTYVISHGAGVLATNSITVTVEKDGFSGSVDAIVV